MEGEVCGPQGDECYPETLISGMRRRLLAVEVSTGTKLWAGWGVAGVRANSAGNWGGVSDDINLLKHLSPVRFLIHLFSLLPCLLLPGNGEGRGNKKMKEGR